VSDHQTRSRLDLAREAICVATDGAVSARAAKDVVVGAGDRANVSRAADRLLPDAVADTSPAGLAASGLDPDEPLDADVRSAVRSPNRSVDDIDFRGADPEAVGGLVTRVLQTDVFGDADEAATAVDARPGADAPVEGVLVAAADHFGHETVAGLRAEAETDAWRETVAHAEPRHVTPPEDVSVETPDIDGGMGL